MGQWVGIDRLFEDGHERASIELVRRDEVIRRATAEQRVAQIERKFSKPRKHRETVVLDKERKVMLHLMLREKKGTYEIGAKLGCSEQAVYYHKNKHCDCRKKGII